MNYSQYTTRELDQKFIDIKDQLDRIENQTTKTNGSVANLKVWKGYITGAVAVIIAIGLPVLGYLSWNGIYTSQEVAAIEGTTHISTYTHTTNTNTTP